ncbi:MAG: hypothetical protein ABEJ36_04205 [Candidatus Nanosalina sp.]
MKGQAKYVVGVFIMIAAISMGMIGNFVTSYTLQEALVSMNENQARYDSLIHSYMILNGGQNFVLNQTEMKDDLSTTSKDYVCNIDGTWVLDHGPRYRVSFKWLEADIKSGGCTAPAGHYYDQPKFRSPGLFLSPYIGAFPDLAFYGTANGGKNFYIHTRVNFHG